MRALIVLGHGSRSADATAQFLQVIELLKGQRPGDAVLPAFMELASPTVPDAVAEALRLGATELVVVPCFLFQGNHIKRDIPELLDAVRAEHPGLTVRYARPIGPDPRIADILNDRVHEVDA
jgi:sirohydrochlorin ferrochelatase